MNSLKIDLNRSYEIDPEMSSLTSKPATAATATAATATTSKSKKSIAPESPVLIEYEGDGKEDPVPESNEVDEQVEEQVEERGEEEEEEEEEDEEEEEEEENEEEKKQKSNKKTKKSSTVKKQSVFYNASELDEFGEQPELTKLYQQHPECILDYVEDVIPKLDQKYVVPGGDKIDNNHRTYPFLTNFERTKIIGLRANQISRGSTPFIDVPRHITDVRDIARLELEQKRLPYIIKRPLPNGKFEYWRLIDLIIL